MSSSLDTGLSKLGLKEVQAIVKESVKDFDGKFDQLNNKIDSIKESLAKLKFQHDWRTAFWVFVGSSTPVAIGFVIFFMNK